MPTVINIEVSGNAEVAQIAVDSNKQKKSSTNNLPIRPMGEQGAQRPQGEQFRPTSVPIRRLFTAENDGTCAAIVQHAAPALL